jgi:dTMP kinase
MQRGKFVVIEGIDGSGKSTQMEILSKKLSSINQEHYLTTEPTDGPIGVLIRKILRKEIVVGESALAGLFLADRLDHLQNELNGLTTIISQGTHVITDRYYWSSYAYHSLHLPMEWVIAINSKCAEILRPDITFYLDLSPEESIRRIKKSRASTELFEEKKILENVRGNYLKSIELLGDKENVVVLDTNENKSPEEVFEEIWLHISKILNI